MQSNEVKKENGAAVLTNGNALLTDNAASFFEVEATPNMCVWCFTSLVQKLKRFDLLNDVPKLDGGEQQQQQSSNHTADKKLHPSSAQGTQENSHLNGKIHNDSNSNNHNGVEGMKPSEDH